MRCHFSISSPNRVLIAFVANVPGNNAQGWPPLRCPLRRWKLRRINLIKANMDVVPFEPIESSNVAYSIITIAISKIIIVIAGLYK